jgi:threonine dehydrogenase-like Zn-dependent dehydrogenase
MRALRAYLAGSGRAPEMAEIPQPSPEDGELLVETIALGVCGTDREIAARGLAATPPGRDWGVLGHEALGRVLESPPGSGFAPGDLVTGIVRRPDPVPCGFCAAGRPDLCENGRFTERGIAGRDGFAAERFRIEPAYAVRVDAGLGPAAVLIEPTSIAVKAWEQIERVAGRPASRVLVLGAGPIGLLCALLAAQRGLEVHVVDRIGRGPKPAQVRALGATYHTSARDLGSGFDRVLECTGHLIADAIARTAPSGAACLVGGGDPRSAPAMNLGELAEELLAANKALVGTVNSGRRHFEAAHEHLRRADAEWLGGLLTRTVPVEQWRSALDPPPEEIKPVLSFQWMSR